MNSKTINLSVRLATTNDCRNIFDWRNDPFTRLMSHDNKKVRWDNHVIWFKSSQKSKTCMLLICEENLCEKIGVVRFDLSELGAITSINLNPNQRGRNLAKECLIESIKYFSKKYPHIKNLFAEVLEKNIVSKKIFFGVDFEKYKVINGVGYYQKRLI